MAYPISPHEVYCYAHIYDPNGDLFKRNLFIQCKGPLNVQGWEKLFSTDPLSELTDFVNANKEVRSAYKC